MIFPIVKDHNTSIHECIGMIDDDGTVNLIEGMGLRPDQIGHIFGNIAYQVMKCTDAENGMEYALITEFKIMSWSLNTHTWKPEIEKDFKSALQMIAGEWGSDDPWVHEMLKKHDLGQIQ